MVQNPRRRGARLCFCLGPASLPILLFILYPCLPTQLPFSPPIIYTTDSTSQAHTHDGVQLNILPSSFHLPGQRATRLGLGKKGKKQTKEKRPPPRLIRIQKLPV
uniref:Uncharacterized protein n=1 Tax=Trypanosoma congolense (strain IL3000) TaxID=1068625 RepID=G0UNH0_TRYCI|nr:hypothetical protein, unlikely [Trypanosoma congolense IL3000]